MRTSLALSCVPRRPVKITNIPLARKNPALQPQHRIAIKAAASIAGDEVQGAKIVIAALHISS